HLVNCAFIAKNVKGGMAPERSEHALRAVTRVKAMLSHAQPRRLYSNEREVSMPAAKSEKPKATTGSFWLTILAFLHVMVVVQILIAALRISRRKHESHASDLWNRLGVVV